MKEAIATKMSSSLEGLRRNSVVKDHVPANMLEKCAALADKYSIEVKRFAAHLDAYLINQEISILSQDQMGKFDQFLLAENKKYSASKPPLPPQHKDGQGASAAKRPFEAQTKEETPAKSAKSSSASSPDAFSQNSLGGTPGSQGGEAYENRKGKGDPVLNNPANAGLGVRGEVQPSDLQPLGLRSRISTDDAEFDNCKERYRYMFTTADQVSECGVCVCVPLSLSSFYVPPSLYMSPVSASPLHSPPPPPTHTHLPHPLPPQCTARGRARTAASAHAQAYVRQSQAGRG